MAEPDWSLEQRRDLRLRATRASQDDPEAVDPDAPLEPEAGSPHDLSMEDVQVRRLEDRIEASNREAQLRLNAAMERIEGSIVRIADQTSAIRSELQEQRADGRAARSEMAAFRVETAGAIDKQTASSKTHFQWLVGIIVATALAVVGVELSAHSLWATGYQSGQTDRVSVTQPSAQPQPPPRSS